MLDTVTPGRAAAELVKGIKVIDAEMAKLNITQADFHGKWNDTCNPRKPDN